MKPDDILDAIGNVDDACVERAKKKSRSTKSVWITVGSLAACLVLVLCIPMIIIPSQGGESAAPNADGEGNEMAIHWDDVWIYYVNGDEICRQREYLPVSPKEIFDVWKEKNSIGDDVEFIEVRIDSNSKTTDSKFNGDDVVMYEIGDYFVYNITVTKTIENYYDTINSELLLKSLKQTMIGYSDIQYDEYNLVLE